MAKLNKKQATAGALRWIVTDLTQHINSAEGLWGELDDDIGEENAEIFREAFRDIVVKLQADSRKADKKAGVCPAWSEALAGGCDLPSGHLGLHSSAGDGFHQKV